MQSTLPLTAIKSAQFSVRDTLSRNDSFGVILSRMNTTQLSFMMINEINQYMSDNYDLDVQIYSSQNEIPIIPPLTGLFNHSELMHHTGPIIACDPTAVTKLPIVNEGQYYYYAYDPLLLNFVDKSFFEFFWSLDIKIIARNKEHAEILKSLNKEIIPRYVPDCNIKILREIVVGR